MAQAAGRIAATLTAILLSGSLALAQQTPAPEPVQDWAQASAVASSKHKLIIATSADPTRRQVCRVKSFTPDQLVCKGSFGKTNTYRPQEIAALILPGNEDLRLGVFFISTAVAVTAYWGLLEFPLASIPIAVIAEVAGIVILTRHKRLRHGIRPTQEVLLYLASGQTLQVKLH